MADEKNVTLDANGKVTIKRAFVSSEPTAKLGKREIHFQLEIKLDESSLAIRDKFAFWHFDETPLQVTIKPVRAQMDLPLGDPALCSGCGAEIWWVVNPRTGKKMPITANALNHFADCPQAQTFRKAKA